MEQIVMYQMFIPADLSEERYISGMEALNLPAPEGTSGDWHFVNVFYTKKQEKISRVTIANIERGAVTNLKISTMLSLANALDSTVEEIFLPR